jgi:hypothetical protein
MKNLRAPKGRKYLKAPGGPGKTQFGDATIKAVDGFYFGALAGSAGLTGWVNRQ